MTWRVLWRMVGLGCWGCWLAATGWAATDQTLYQGPVLELSVQRGEARLPLAWVDHLQRGDRVWVKAQAESLAKGDWVMLLATVSPSGNQVKTARFDLSQPDTEPMIEISDEHQVPVVVLAPQLRNLFGLYTSFKESADLLRDAVQSDPQRFFELQKLDQINQAISALRRGLDQLLQNKSPEEAVTATQALAAKFGVKTIDPDCFKSNQVNTQCVALSMMANRDFVVPSNDDLSSMLGAQKAADLTGFLASSLHLFAAAGDFLANKFRDQYAFAPAFARTLDQDQKRQLFSLVRFRNGNLKTAYVYAPAWSMGTMPKLNWTPAAPLCLSRWQLQATVQGRLSLVNHWHDWHLSALDPQGQSLASTQDLVFDPNQGRLDLGPQAQETLRNLSGPVASVQLSAYYAFEPLAWPAFPVAVPASGNWGEQLQGLSNLVSGEVATLTWADTASAPCVAQLDLQTGSSAAVAAKPTTPGHWELNLQHTPAGEAQLKVALYGAESQRVPVRILKPMAHIQSISHADLETQLLLRGEHLERLQSVSWGDTHCQATQATQASQPTDATKTSLTRLALACDQDIRHNDLLPEQVQVNYPDQEPASSAFRLTKTQAAPHMQVAENSPNSLLIHPSLMALQWGLGPQDPWLTQDSGLGFLFQTTLGYRLGRGSYRLELKFQDDPLTEQKPISTVLISDPAHNELRTRNPVVFKDRSLPGVLNPLFWRVVEEATELASPWQALGRSVLVLPDLQALTCATPAQGFWLQGRHLDQIDSVQFLDPSSPPASPSQQAAPLLEACPDGLCLRVPGPTKSAQLQVALHWVDGHRFHVKMAVPDCSTSSD